MPGASQLPRPDARHSATGVTPLQERWLSECDRVAAINLCTHRDVGAIIIKQGDIVSVGRNNMPGHNACVLGGCPRGMLPPGKGALDYSDCVAVHAEMNAIIRAGSTQCRGAMMIVNSLPCHLCFRLARGAGIVFVGYRYNGEWHEVTF